MGNFVEVAEFTNPVAEILGSDPRNAATYNARFQAAFNRTLFLYQRTTTTYASDSGAPLVALNSAAWTEIVHADVPFDVIAGTDFFDVSASVNGTMDAGMIAEFGIGFHQLTGPSAGFEDLDADSEVEVSGYASGGLLVVPVLSYWLIDDTPAHFSDGTIRVRLMGRVPGGAPDVFNVLKGQLKVKLEKQ